MDLGRHLRELSRVRFGVAACTLIALFSALSMSYQISLFPPGLKTRSLMIAAASTEVLVDTPTSLVLDLRQDTHDVQALTDRAVLIGNVLASAPVLSFIERRAGLPQGVIKAETPRTPNSPRAFETTDNKKKTSDLLRSTDQYRLDIEANPTVPVLKLYAQAPSAKAAGQLANAAVVGLRDYLQQLAVGQGINPRSRVNVAQLGTARGKVINDGVSLQLTFVAFLFFFFASAAAAIFVARVRKGFKLADERDTEAAPARPRGSGQRSA